MRSRRGFTLIELMIVVAIIGILASIAIPNFLQLLLRTKRAELPMNLDAVRTAEAGYYAEWGQFTSAPTTPPAVAGRTTTVFTGGGFVQYDLLGWSADGKVRGTYTAVALNGSSSAVDDYVATAQADIDGDGSYAEYMTNRTFKPIMLTPNNVY